MIDRNTATEIANSFFSSMNPTFWDGEGERPSGFDTRVHTYSLNPLERLDISMYQEEDDTWNHYCEIVDEESNEIIEVLSGYGIDSINNLVDTIMDLCKETEFIKDFKQYQEYEFQEGYDL